ncbi:hypothetical protein N657DRAFT_576128 [Parathielavia appendiculata]|uniref:RNA polymerase III RPC4 n=1 Tax=Parathielavia appendiculata TaxID=2587402 RepID=A0AAN6TXM5_9PEZI|nr:hypothetical protein N657DRAFT_576128 [Parathielavia appendiculata]
MVVPSDNPPSSEGLNVPTVSREASSTPAPTSSSRGSAASKFKPKAVRRSETERARIAEEQLRIQEQRNAEEARRLARLNRGRGRGRARGRGGFNFRTAGAAGPLAAGLSFGSGGSSGQGGYAFASSSGYVKNEGQGQGERSTYGASGIVDNSRINADLLYNYVEISDEEDQASITSTQKKKKKPIMPMGIRRVEHKDEGVTMTTAAEIEAQEKAGAVEEESDDDALFVSRAAQVEDFDEAPMDEGVGEPAQTRNIKKEEVEAGAMDLDELPEGQRIKAPESPELKKKVLVGQQKAKKSSAPKDPEAEAIANDLQRMLNLFTVRGEDGQVAEDGTANNAALEGHMFLFQFPPVLPPLHVVPRDGTSANPIAIKPEPDDDVVMLNEPPVNIDLTQDDNAKVKKEDEGEEEPEGQAKEKSDELKEGGYIGNLVVRKSGKVELSWGGQKLELMPGIQSNFLSTAVLIEHADKKPDDPSQMAGVAYGMGKIQGSFTLAPVWGDEEEWVVDPKDLEVPEK